MKLSNTRPDVRRQNGVKETTTPEEEEVSYVCAFLCSVEIKRVSWALSARSHTEKWNRKIAQTRRKYRFVRLLQRMMCQMNGPIRMSKNKNRSRRRRTRRKKQNINKHQRDGKYMYKLFFFQLNSVCWLGKQIRSCSSTFTSLNAILYFFLFSFSSSLAVVCCGCSSSCIRCSPKRQHKSGDWKPYVFDSNRIWFQLFINTMCSTVSQRASDGEGGGTKKKYKNKIGVLCIRTTHSTEPTHTHVNKNKDTRLPFRAPIGICPCDSSEK